jgi:hypothetical protein
MTEETPNRLHWFRRWLRTGGVSSLYEDEPLQPCIPEPVQDTYLGQPLQDGQWFVDITVDRSICGWFAICQACRGTKIHEGGCPADVERACRRHSRKYHEGEATFGYYADGARHRDTVAIWGHLRESKSTTFDFINREVRSG